MKIAVTGASGFIGRYVVQSLVARGCEVIAIGRNAPKDQNEVTFVKSDLVQDGDYSWLLTHRPTHLLHLAWFTKHGEFWSSPENVRWCDATARLTDAFGSAGGERLVIAGSYAEYDWSFGFFNENRTPAHPASLYGVAKDCARRMAEQLCERHEVSIAWGRLFIPFGRGEDANRLIPSIVNALLDRRPAFSINVSCWRDFLPVGAAADAFTFLLSNDKPGIFNICSGIPIQLGELITYIAGVLDKDPASLMEREIVQPEVPKVAIGDNSALTQLGWSVEVDIWPALETYTNQIRDLPNPNNGMP